MRDGTLRYGAPPRWRAPDTRRPTPGRGRKRRQARTWAAAGLAVSLAVLPAATANAHGPGTEPTKDTLPPGVGLVELAGTPLVRVYDPATNRWTQRANMHFSRWYPTAVILPDGKVFVDTGTRRSQRNDQGTQQRLTETYDPNTNRWTVNNTGLLSQNSLPLYARTWLMPNGKLFYDGTGQAWGPGGQAFDEATWAIKQFFNLKTKQWEPVADVDNFTSVPSDVMLRMHAPYTSSTVLQSGGVVGPSPDTAVSTPISKKTTVTKSGAVTTTLTGPLNHGRWAAATVVLPTGEVATFNGADREELDAPGTERVLRQMEIFNPATNRWTGGPLTHRDRSYHNTAILLPDARVLIGGHAPAPNSLLYPHDNPTASAGLSVNGDRDPSFEIYSPAYLFRGARPAIRHAPAGIAWGKPFTVGVSNNSDISEVVLSRLPAQTHTSDVNQRTLVLPFKKLSGNRLSVSAPPNGVTAPPGPYYLFVHRKTAKGPVPSVARILTVGKANSHEAVQPFATNAGVPTGGSATPTQNTSAKRPGECYECTPNRAAQPDPVFPRTLAQKQATGDISAPFEEGGKSTPRCHRGTYAGKRNYILCKPTAQTSIVTPQGKVLYWDGFGGTENSKTFIRDGGETVHNAFTRVLDLTSGHPRFTVPSPQEPPGVNPDIAKGLAPNDPMPNDGDIFCSYQVHLANGRIFAPGGTDWYDDLLQTDLIDPFG